MVRAGFLNLEAVFKHSLIIIGMVLKVAETGIELTCDGLAVEVLPYEYEFDHTVAVMLMPVAHHVGILLHEHHQIFFGGCGIPLPGFSEFLLHSCLFEKI